MSIMLFIPLMMCAWFLEGIRDALIRIAIVLEEQRDD